jgi:site-specific DNA-methyltransferase (adenine-specific)
MAPGDYDLVIGDVLETLPAFAGGRFDLIIADPPFNIRFDKGSHEYGATEYKLYRDDMTEEQYLEFTRRWVMACHGALGPHGSMYIVSGWTNLRQVLDAVASTPLHMLNHIVWRFSWGVYTRRRFVTSHYHVLLLVKDPKAYTFNKLKGYEEDVWDREEVGDPGPPMRGEELWEEGDVWFFPDYNRGNDPDRIKGHPCQLPIQLLRKMVLTSSNEGDLVGDVFSGSGGTILAARQTGRKVVGFERDPDYERVIKQKAMWDQEVPRWGEAKKAQWF